MLYSESSRLVNQTNIAPSSFSTAPNTPKLKLQKVGWLHPYARMSILWLAYS